MESSKTEEVDAASTGLDDELLSWRSCEFWGLFFFQKVRTRGKKKPQTTINLQTWRFGSDDFPFHFGV